MAQSHKRVTPYGRMQQPGRMPMISSGQHVSICNNSPPPPQRGEQVRTPRSTDTHSALYAPRGPIGAASCRREQLTKATPPGGGGGSCHTASPVASPCNPHSPGLHCQVTARYLSSRCIPLVCRHVKSSSWLSRTTILMRSLLITMSATHLWCVLRP